MVVVDKQDYISKVEDLLEQSDTCRILVSDPVKGQKNRLINILDSIKAEGDVGDNTFKSMYPRGEGPKGFVGYPHFTKRHPFRPIASRDTALYGWPRN